jgi:spectinomycin phosphotransferase
MLEEPKLSTKKIITCLQDSYNLLVSHITFHSLGNDPNSWVYEVDTSNKKYFLKVKKEKIYAPSLEVPRFLKDQGIGEVLAPVKNKEQKLWVCVEEFYLILYLFVEGATGREIGMTQGQWVRFGSVLRKVHSSKLPPELLQKIRKENFIPRCA